MLRKNNLTTTVNNHSIDARVALIVSLYNRELTRALEEKCVAELIRLGVIKNHIEVFYVPGAFEIPLVCQQAVKTKKYSVIIALGVIIKGDTYHFELVADSCARGIMDVMLKHDIPIVFEVLAGERKDMIKRAGSDEYNRGIEAANTAVQILPFAI